MIELRKRVLSSGFVVLECRQRNYGACMPDDSTFVKWTEWAPVPYVNDAGDPLQIDDKTGLVREVEHADV